MKVLVIGSGGREHALAWRLARSPKVQQVYVAPGNGGIVSALELKNVPITNLTELREWAQAEKIGLYLSSADKRCTLGNWSKTIVES